MQSLFQKTWDEHLSIFRLYKVLISVNFRECWAGHNNIRHGAFAHCLPILIPSQIAKAESQGCLKETVFKRGWTLHLWRLLTPPMSRHRGLLNIQKYLECSQITPAWIPDRLNKCQKHVQKSSEIPYDLWLPSELPQVTPKTPDHQKRPKTVPTNVQHWPTMSHTMSNEWAKYCKHIEIFMNNL